MNRGYRRPGAENSSFLWIGVIAALAYSGWIVYSRRAETNRIEQAAEQKRSDSDQKIIEKLGSGQLKILMLYANPAVMKSGVPGLLCYGVSNAKSVRFDPPVDGAGPALSRCVEIRPKAEATYTLIATDEKGNEARESVTVQLAK